MPSDRVVRKRRRCGARWGVVMRDCRAGPTSRPPDRSADLGRVAVCRRHVDLGALGLRSVAGGSLGFVAGDESFPVGGVGFALRIPLAHSTQVPG
jgi:hypothetical protein